MEKRRNSATYYILLMAFLLIGGLMLFANLGDTALCEWDEARHGTNAYEMMQRGEMVVATYRGEVDVWNLKPPLSEWCIMLGYRLFGYNGWGLRFYSAFSGFCTLLVVAVWIKKRRGKLASLLALMAFLACRTVYDLHFARYGDADALFVLFYTISMLCMMDSVRNVRWLYGSALAFGFAFMAKGFHAALIPVTCLLYTLWAGVLKRLKPRHFAALIGLGLLPVLPWAALRYGYDGFAFLGRMLTQDVLTRATTVLEGHQGDGMYYVNLLWNMPVVKLALGVSLAALIAGWVAHKRLTNLQKGLLLWGLVPLAAFSLCVSKLEWYLDCTLPVYALAIGTGCVSLINRAGRFKWLQGCIAAAMTITLCLWIYGNWQYVSNGTVQDDFQNCIQGYCDRDVDAQTPAYIAYVYPEPSNVWRQDDLLCAQLYGDLDCLDGGMEAFGATEEHAFLLCMKDGIENWQDMENYALIYEDHRVLMYDNLY